MLARIWAENKRFILIVGGALCVFLLLNGFISSYLESSRGLLAKASQLEKDTRALVKALRPYWDEKKRLEDYERHEAALRGEIELPPEEELSRLDEAAPLVQFNQAIDRTWGAALEKANRLAVAIPDKLGPQELWIDRGDQRPEYEEHYAYVAIVRRTLNALIEAGMAEIGKLEPRQEDRLAVLADDDSVECVYRSVHVKVGGTYDSFLRVLKSLQGPRNFIQVNVLSLAPRTPGEERLVKGELEFVGVQLVEGATASKDERPAARPARRTRGKGR